MASIVDDRGFNQGFEWSQAQQVRIRRRASAIAQALAPGATRVLEWGCGTGELASFLAQSPRLRVTGVDLCGRFVEEAQRRFGHERLGFQQADLAREDALGDLGGAGAWEAVVGNGILHHLYYRIGPALRTMRSMLAPGGQLVFWEPNLFNPYVFAIFTLKPLRRLTRLEPDEMAFPPAWIERELLAAGFRDVHVAFRDFLLPNVPMGLVPAVTRVGDVLERAPVVRRLAQSLFITATRA
ncbi:MAG: methyltransferase [Deltaproteobacteria bacterium]|nr:methyltransferase [Deltaproteobacteria bacterium]